MLGGAYERPDIALRIALTYNSTIETNHTTVETVGGGVVSTAPTEIETPESVNLDFQTGIAADTLLFGGIRWVNWTDFEISPAFYSSPAAVGQPFLSYDDTYGRGAQVLGNVVGFDLCQLREIRRRVPVEPRADRRQVRADRGREIAGGDVGLGRAQLHLDR